MITPLVVSKREAARLLGIDRGATLAQLLDAGLLRVVPWGRGSRIPLVEVERLALKGYTLPTATPKARPGRKPARRADPEALRRLDVESL